MREYLLFEVKAFLFQKKNLGILAVWFLISLGIIGQILFLDEGNHEEELYNELNDTRIVLRTVENYYRESDSEVTLADNLYQQQGLIASKYNGILFSEDDWFYQAGIELADLRLAADDYSDEKVPPSLFPRKDFSKRQRAEYQVRKEKELPVRTNSKNLYDYSIKLLSLYGSLAFLFTLLLTSDLGLGDLSHPSLVKSYPIKRNSRLFIQTGTRILAGTIGLALLSGLSLFLAEIIFKRSDWLWPVAYYNQSSYQTMNLFQYVFLLLAFLFLLMIHTSFFSYLMNQLFENQYVTLMIGAVVYSIGFILPSTGGWISWLSIPYYHLDKVMTGFFAEEVYAGIDLSRGIISLILWGVFFLLISLRLIHPSRRKEKKNA